MANFAFWVGLMKGRPTEFDDLPKVMDFKDAKSNFIRAARTGSESIMSWKGKVVPLNQLVLNELLPISRNGLEKMQINKEDIDKYLNVIKIRISKHTGSQWMVKNYRNLKEKLKPYDASVALTAAIHANQQTGRAIGEWPGLHDFTSFESTSSIIGHIMTSDLVTASANDLALLTLQFMKWNNIHHLPVVDNTETLVGLITWRHLTQYWDQVNDSGNLLCVREIMAKNVITVETSTPIKQAIDVMKKHNIGCLPILQDSQLVGIVTVKDLIHFDKA
jgi:CBS domain-containing protein